MSGETQKNPSKVIPIKANIGDISEKAASLFKFLRESVRENFRQIHTIDSYEEVLFLSDIPRERGCHCVAWQPTDPEETSETWVEIRKPRMPNPPDLPAELEAWISEVDIHDASLEFPEPREKIAVEIPASELDQQDDQEQRIRYLNWEEQDDLKKIWEEYVEGKWWPWREVYREMKPVQDVYNRLFTFYNRQLRLGESFEIVLGLGFLTWTTPQGLRIARHLITAHAANTWPAIRGAPTGGRARSRSTCGVANGATSPLATLAVTWFPCAPTSPT